MVFSRLSNTTDRSTTGFPSGPAVTRLSGIVLHEYGINITEQIYQDLYILTRLFRYLWAAQDLTLGICLVEHGSRHSSQ